MATTKNTAPRRTPGGRPSTYFGTRNPAPPRGSGGDTARTGPTVPAKPERAKSATRHDPAPGTAAVHRDEEEREDSRAGAETLPLVPGGNEPSTPGHDEQLPDLALQIKLKYEVHLLSFRQTLEAAIAIGGLLLRAKEQVKHGDWNDWVETNCDFSTRTASGYMRMYRNRDQIPVSDPPLRQSTADLTIDACLKQLAKPRSKPTSDQPVSAPSATVTVEVGSEGGDRPALHDTAKAKPKPPLDTSPAADQPEVPKSPSKAKCAAPVEDVARHGAEDEVPDDPDSEDEPPDDDLSDDGWLETLELRSKLSDTTIFDQEALLYRHLMPGLAAQRRVHQPTEEEIAKSRVLTWVPRRFSRIYAFYAAVLPPSQWRLCPKCQGSGRCSHTAIECPPCEGAGFEIARENDGYGEDV